jgi:hypothetical protein
MNPKTLKEIKKLLSEVSGEKLGDMTIVKEICDGELIQIVVTLSPKNDDSTVKIGYQVVNISKNTDQVAPPDGQ